MLKVFLSFSLALLFSLSAAAVTPVILKTAFHNHDWVPLTKTEMKSAAVDPALEELTRAKMLAIVSRSKTDKNAGELTVDVSLVEAAESAKVTITYRAKGIPTQVTSSAVNLHGLDHQGIFKALVRAGPIACA